MAPFTLIILGFAALTLGAPYNASSQTEARMVQLRDLVEKRTNPIIGQDIDVNDPDRGGKLVPRSELATSGAFSNAQQMIASVLFFPTKNIDTDSPIFSHYFNEEDRAKVKAVFAKLAGNPPDQSSLKPEGADELGQITFQGIDTPDDNDNGCEVEGTRMYMDYYDTDGPVVVVCEDAWVFPDRDTIPGDSDDPCTNLGTTMTEEMAILGTLVLHEYTHWDWLLSGITGGSVTDNHPEPDGVSGYGLMNAYFDLDKSLAPLNADSYAWYATESLWSGLCGVDYAPPTDDDSD